MRFCPFCSAENADELAVCQSCGRRLPPLPPRRARNAPPTGVLLPPRTSTTTQPPPVTAPRRSSATNPPPNASQSMPAMPAGSAAPAAPPAPRATSAGLVPVVATAPGLRAPATAIGLPAAPGLPTTAPTSPPVGPTSSTGPIAATRSEESNRALANALSPGPAAQRRDPPPSEPPDPGASARRRSDLPLAPAVPPGIQVSRVAPSVGNGPRPGSTAPPLASPRPATSSGLRPGSGPSVAPPPVAPHAASDPPWASHQVLTPAMLGDLDTQPQPAPPSVAIVPVRRRADDGIEPPPTRIHRPEALADRPFTPPQVSPIPEIPEPGLVNSARYAIRFAKARWQRRGAIRALGGDIKQDTDALDQVLGALGGVARTAKVDGRVFSGENAAITVAEQRAQQMAREHNDVDVRKLEENSKFVDVERERNAKLGEADRLVEEAQKELAQLETQRRALRDKRKELERRQKAYLKAAEDSEKQTGGADQGDSRQELRRAADQHRREAAALEPERQDVDRRLGSIERPIAEATAKLDAAKAELDAAKRSLSDAREGHTHRLAELDAEQKRKAREIAQAEGEIARRLVTLGTLVNLNRIEDPQFAELYDRIDRLRGAITARTTEIEKLTAEREAYDRGNLVRGVATIGGAIILFIALIVILRAALSH